MDQLNTYLTNKYSGYITGRQDCNLLILGDGDTPKLCTLIMGMEYDPLEDAESYLTNGLFDRLNTNDSYFRKMYQFGDEIASKRQYPLCCFDFSVF